MPLAPAVAAAPSRRAPPGDRRTAAPRPDGSAWARRARQAERVLEIALAVLFVAAAAAKLAGEPMMVATFGTLSAATGVGAWFRYFTGALEVIGAALLLIPALAGVGAVLLGAVLVGAIVAHLTVLGAPVVMPVVLLLALAAVAYTRRASLERYGSQVARQL